MKAHDERPLPPFKPRQDAKVFPQDDTGKFVYEHQHTRGWGPIRTCFIVEQHDDGYCKVITGHGIGNKPATAVAWSGCLTKGNELNTFDRNLIDAYHKSKSALQSK